MNVQSSNNVVVANDKVVINGILLPHVPSESKNHNSTIINDKVFINGYEWKNGKWKRTFRALFHLIF